MVADFELTIHRIERQWSVNDLWFCQYSNYTVSWVPMCITDVLAVYIGKRDSNMVTTPL